MRFPVFKSCNHPERNGGSVCPKKHGRPVRSGFLDYLTGYTWKAEGDRGVSGQITVCLYIAYLKARWYTVERENQYTMWK